MTYLTFKGAQEQNNGTFSLFIGNNKSHHIGLISTTTNLITNSVGIITNNENLDTCSFYTGPSDSNIIAFGENFETCGSIADASYSSDGSYGAAETCGSIATSDSSSCDSFSLCC